ncbi:DUF1186 domain-containing protein [Rheinheimera texasensis]|uniref:DUF1186 domain-containing protein n=1 Tax=Rheinheimera texasensis TaxID=306205 RepID=UPI0032B150B8
MTASMTLDEILLRLSTEQQVSADAEQLLFPADALLAAKSHWAEFWPHIAALMQRMQADEELSDDEYQLLFYGVMLLADVADLSQAPAFMQWVDTTDGLGSDLEYTLGDAMTEDLATMLFVLSAGQSVPLQQLLLSEKAGIYVKAAALAALFAQLELAEQQDQAPDTTTLVPLLQQVIDVASRHGQKFVLGELAIWCISFGLQQLKPAFELLLRQNKIDTKVISTREISRWQLANSEKPIASGLVRPSFDVMSLRHWLAFQPDSVAATAEPVTAGRAISPENAMSTKVLVGRNDACPCGSGKKYKKCCLN